jgi:hypothetical protein
MQPKNVYTNLGYDVIINGTPDSHIASVSSRLLCQPGTIVHGNMKDPNDWQYLCSFQKYPKGKLSSRYYLSGTVVENVGYLGPFAPTQPSWDRDNMYNRALEKINAKVRGSLDLSVALAEAGTTFRMVKATANLVRYAEDYVRRPKVRDAANYYLQWKYGWRPLCSDIFDAANESARVVLNTMQRVSARVTEPLPSSQLTEVSFGGYDVPAVKRTIGKQSCTIVLDLAVPDASFQIDRWMSLNPVSILWEIIPYSFVVDWVYNVSGFLRNLETALLYNTFFRTGYVSELFVADGVETQRGPFVVRGPVPFGTVDEVTGMYSEFTFRQFIRRKLLGYPMPRPPTFKVDLGASQLTSAAALLTQIFTKGK